LFIVSVALATTVSPTLESSTGGQVSPLMEGRVTYPGYPSSYRIAENILPSVRGPASRRPGTKYIAQIPSEIFYPYRPYELTRISENGSIWGIPIDFATMTTLYLDSSADVNAGGGLVNLPFCLNPFKEGQSVRINGTDNYDGEYVLQDGTDGIRIQIIATFAGETFNGDETVVQVYSNLTAGAGRMVQDEDSNLYYGHTAGITKISEDGTVDANFFSPTGGWTAGKTNFGTKLSFDDSSFLYSYVGDDANLYKFNLATGAELWQVDTDADYGYDIGIDSSDNVYVLNSAASELYYDQIELTKYTAANGTKTSFTKNTKGAYAIRVDNDMGVVITGGQQKAKHTYISDGGGIYRVPINYKDYSTLTLDVNGVAVNVGGGIVGLPCTKHSFIIGDVVRITGTSNYDDSFTLTSGTTANELQFTGTYIAETFDGTETVVQYIALTAGLGRMDYDEDGVLYYGRNILSGQCVDKITNGVVDSTFITPTTAFTGTTCTGVKVSNDSAFLYVATDGKGLWKFDLSDGSEVWVANTGNGIVYDIDIDSDDNVYAAHAILSTLNLFTHCYSTRKFAAADGSMTTLTFLVSHYNMVIDNDMGRAISGSDHSWRASDAEYYKYNLFSTNLDGGEAISVQLGTPIGPGVFTTYHGPPIGTGCIVTYENFIYILMQYNGTLYKLDPDLNVVSSTTDLPTYPVGIFIDTEGNIVIVNQDNSEYQSDVFWFYDTNLNYISKIDGFANTLLRSWSPAIGYLYFQGNVVFPTPLYNLTICDLDSTTGKSIALGGLYYEGGYMSTELIPTGCITTYGDYLYVLCYSHDLVKYQIYKLDTSLNIITQVDASDYAVGIFVDTEGHIVIINQDESSAKTDTLWFYNNDDLSYLAKIDGFYDLMLKTWDDVNDWKWMQGDVAFYSDIPAGGVFVADADEVVRLIPFECSTDDSYILGLGDGYMGFFRTDANGNGGQILE